MRYFKGYCFDYSSLAITLSLRKNMRCVMCEMFKLRSSDMDHGSMEEVLSFELHALARQMPVRGKRRRTVIRVRLVTRYTLCPAGLKQGSNQDGVAPCHTVVYRSRKQALCAASVVVPCQSSRCTLHQKRGEQRRREGKNSEEPITSVSYAFAYCRLPSKTTLLKQNGLFSLEYLQGKHHVVIHRINVVA